MTNDIHTSGSEVARLTQQIEAEYQAAHQALTGFASGNAKHAFITARMERIATYHQTLTALVGECESTVLLCDILERDG